MTVHKAAFESGLLVKHRYVVALKPSAEACAAIGGRIRESGVPKPLALDRLHVSLFVVGDFETEPEGLADEMRGRMEVVRAEAFDVALTRFGPFGDSLVPGPARALRGLQAQIARALTAAGIAPHPGFAFNPHVTLGYGGASQMVARQPIDPIAWRATDFVLIHSLLRLTIHREIGRWHLIEQPRLL